MSLMPLKEVPVSGSARWCRICGMDLDLAEFPVRCPCCKRAWCEVCADHNVAQCRARRRARLNERYRQVCSKLSIRKADLQERMRNLGDSQGFRRTEIKHLLWDVERRQSDADYRYREIKRDIEGDA